MIFNLLPQLLHLGFTFEFLLVLYNLVNKFNNLISIVIKEIIKVVFVNELFDWMLELMHNQIIWDVIL